MWHLGVGAGEALPQAARAEGATGDRRAHGRLGADDAHLLPGPGDGGVEQLAGQQPGVRGGSSTVTSSAWLPWLLCTVIACRVSTSASRAVANRRCAADRRRSRRAASRRRRRTTTPVSPL